MQLETHYEDDSVILASGPNVVVAAWTAAPRLDQVQRLDELNELVRSESPEGSVLINVMVRGMPAFETEVLNATTQIRKSSEGWRWAVAHVLLVDGLVSATVRAFLSTVSLVSRARTPWKVTGSIEEGAQWVTHTLSRESEWRWSEAELTEALTQLCAGR